MTWQMAELLATAHMAGLGFTDARATGRGTDGGIDCVATGAVAQVKNWATPVGSPEVQKLRGAAYQVTAIFYSLSGYTRAAELEAERAGVALFRYDAANRVYASNIHAELLEQGTGADGVTMEGLLQWTADVVSHMGRTNTAAHHKLAHLRNHAVGGRAGSPNLRVHLDELERWLTALAEAGVPATSGFRELLQAITRDPTSIDEEVGLALGTLAGKLWVLREEQQRYLPLWGAAAQVDVDDLHLEGPRAFQ